MWHPGSLTWLARYSKTNPFKRCRTKQTARKSTGGRCPREPLVQNPLPTVPLPTGAPAEQPQQAAADQHGGAADSDDDEQVPAVEGPEEAVPVPASLHPFGLGLRHLTKILLTGQQLILGRNDFEPINALVS